MTKEWAPIKFKDIVDDFKRGPFGSTIKKSFFVPTGYKVYEQQNAIYDDYTKGKYFISGNKFHEMEEFAVSPGDFIVSCSGTIGKISRLPQVAPKGVINQALLRIRLNQQLANGQWFLYLFRSLFFQSRILKETRGSAMKNIAGVKELREVDLELPAIPEQKQIISYIEEYSSDLDNAIENLKKAKEQLKVFRLAVLKAGFAGQFTKVWRDKFDGDINKWERDNYFKTIKKYSTNKRKIKEKEYLSTGKLPVIDQGQSLIGGYTDRNDCKIECELPVIVFGDHTKIVKFVNFEFAPGADGIKVIKPDARFRPLLFYYFTLFLAKALPEKGYARHFQHFKNIIVPIPSLPEQDEIIKEIESRFSVCDKLEEAIESSLQQAESLRQSIFKQAFEGKLTEQWREKHEDLIIGDNSADALLKRIEVEKEALRGKSKRKKKYD
jgi:type I restriction enzyme S subunit